MGNGAPRPEQEVASEQWFEGGETEQNLGARPTELGHVASFVNRNTLRVSVIHRRVSQCPEERRPSADAGGRASTPRVVARFCRYSRCSPPRASLILKHSACSRAVLQVYCFRSSPCLRHGVGFFGWKSVLVVCCFVC